MKRTLAVAAAGLVALTACGPQASTTTTAATPTVVVTETRTPTPAPTTAKPSATPTPTPAPSTSIQVTATRSPVPSTTWKPATYPSVAENPSVYYIDRDSKGPLGCGDTAVAAVRLNPTNTPVRDAMTQLLADKSTSLGESGLFNSLAESDLTYADGHFDAPESRVDVWLTGKLVQGGTCDIARIKAQLELTALSAAKAKHVMIWINGEPLGKALDQRG